MAARTWTGLGADANWSTALNWDGGVSVPATTDSVTFDVTGAAFPCTIDALGTWSGGTLTIASTYANTVTQSANVSGVSTMSLSSGVWDCAGFDFSCGSASFTVAAATWDQGEGTITTGAFVCNNSSGSITATSSTWNLGGSFTRSNNPTFTASGGIINITAASTFNPGNFTLDTGGAKVTINAGSGTVDISAGVTCPLGATPVSTVGTGVITQRGVVTWTGLWTHTGQITVASTGTLTGSSSPTISMTRSMTVQSGGVITNPIATITFTETATLTDTTDALSATTYVINVTSSVTVAASTKCRLGASPTVTIGAGNTFIVTGEAIWSGVLTVSRSMTVSATTGILTGTSTPTLKIGGNLTINTTATITNPISAVTLIQTGTITDTADKLSAAIYSVSTELTANVGFTVAASTICRLGTNPVFAIGSGTLVVTGEIRWDGNLSKTGNSTNGITVNSTGILTGTTSPTITLVGNLNVNASATVTNPIATITINSTTTSTITDTGDKLSGSTYVLGDGSNKSITVAAGTTVRLGANATVDIGTGTLTVTGTINASGSWTHPGSLTLTATTGQVTGALTDLNFGEGAITFNTDSVWPNGVNLNWTPTSGTARTFALNGETFGTFRRIGSASAQLTITGSNTFTTFRDDDGLVAHTIVFTAGTTQTIGTFTVSGTSGNVVTMESSSAGSAATLTTTGGADTRVSYCSIKDSTVDASPRWMADVSCTNVSGNTNWLFGSYYFGEFQQPGRNRRGHRLIPRVV